MTDAKAKTAAAIRAKLNNGSHVRRVVQHLPILPDASRKPKAGRRGHAAPGPPWSAAEYAPLTLVPSGYGAPGAAAMRLFRGAKCAAKRLRVRLGLCHGSDGPLRSPAQSRLRMVRHCVRLTTPARTCSTTYQRTRRRGILGRRPPSCFSLRLMAWITSALRRGKSSLRYSLQARWCRKGLKAGKTNRDKKAPLCGGAECHAIQMSISAAARQAIFLGWAEPRERLAAA
jgi:hypothetical protein